MHLQSRSLLQRRLATSQFPLPSLKQSFRPHSSDIEIDKKLALQDSIHQLGIDANPQKLAERQRHDEVRRVSFKIDDLMRNRSPENGQSPRFDRGSATAEEVCQ